MQPETGIALDVSPYNTFTLRCTASVPDTVLLQKSFDWREEEGGSAISDNGNSILISRQDLSRPESISELTLNDPSVGNHTYFCTVNMSVPGGMNIFSHSSGILTVKGLNLVIAIFFIDVTLYYFFQVKVHLFSQVQ